MNSSFFQGIRIKYADWPYILWPFGLILVITAITIWLTSMLTGLLVFMILALFTLLFFQFHVYRSIRRDLRDQQQKNQAYRMLNNLLDFREPVPYMTDWAATPELALAITQVIRQTKPEFILELGSGISTLISSLNLSQQGSGSVLAIDHDEDYAKKTARLIRNHKLESIVSIRYSPLTDVKMSRGVWKWYDLSDISIDNPVDLLIVDGPPFKTRKYARYPALPLLYDKLAQNAVVIVHDTHRINEATSIEWWMDEYPGMSVEKIDSEKGITIVYTNKE